MLLSLQEISGLTLRRKNELSIFHLVGDREDREEMLKQFNHWRKNYETQPSHKLKGLIVLYLDPRQPQLPKQ